MTRKSKYDLEPFALIKIPLDFATRLRAVAGDNWTERARDVLLKYLKEVEEQ